MVDANCNIIVTVGFLLGDDTLAAAKKNPDIKFAIVDNNDPKTYPAAKNLKPLVFNTAQSSFMAGYLAAGMTQTKKVGTFGGAKIPTVTIFMDGFSQGVDYYNKQKGDSVQVLGWDAAKQDGQFIRATSRSRTQGRPDHGPGSDQPGRGHHLPGGRPGRSRRTASSQGQRRQGERDLGRHRRLRQRRELLPEPHQQRLQGHGRRGDDAIKAAKDDSFSNEPFVGTLENKGTGLSPYNEFDDKVPAELKTELDPIKADIISGKIKIESKSQPTPHRGARSPSRSAQRSAGSPVTLPHAEPAADRVGSPARVSPSGSARWWPTTGSTWTSCPARSTACWGRTGPASRP